MNRWTLPANPRSAHDHTTVVDTTAASADPKAARKSSSLSKASGDPSAHPSVDASASAHPPADASADASAGTSAGTDDTRALSDSVARALESGDAVRLGRLFPSNRKVRVSLEQIARLEGFVGAGPLVEALRRYVSSRSEVHYDCAATPRSGDSASSRLRIRGTLSSRERESGRRERIGLELMFERIDGDWRAVEVRETG